MKALRLSIGLGVLLGWLAFAFMPRSPASAGPPDLDVYPEKPVTLNGTVLYETDRLALPTQAALVGEHLVVVDRWAEQAVHVLSAANGALLRSMGREGEGPGEFRVARFIDPDPGSENSFWVYDAALSRLTHVDLEQWDRLPAWERRTVQLQSDAPVTNPVWVDEDRLLALGFFMQGRIGEFDGAGQMRRFLGDLPGSDASIPPHVLQHAYQGIMKTRPDRSLVVIANRHASTVEIYTAAGDLVERASGPFSFDPRFEVGKAEGGPTMMSGKDMRFGYLDVAPTRDRIYALFSGRTRAGYPDRATYGEYIHVFDWEGRYIEAIKLDAEVAAIAADERRGRLIAIRHLPVPAVLEYSIADSTGL
jgi:hypothetical protein